MEFRRLEKRTAEALQGCRAESTAVLTLPVLGWGLLLLFELLGRYCCTVLDWQSLLPWVPGLRCLLGAVGSVPLCSGTAWWFMQAAAGENNSLSDYFVLLRSPGLNLRAARLYGLLWLLTGVMLLPAGICVTGIRLLLRAALEQTDCFWYLFGSMQLAALLLLWLWLACYILTGILPVVFLFAMYPFRSPAALCRMSFARMRGNRGLLLLHLLRWLPLLPVPGGGAGACMGLAVLLMDTQEETYGTAQNCDRDAGAGASA